MQLIPNVGTLQDLVSSLSSRGIYTILDLHQDVLWEAGEPEETHVRRMNLKQLTIQILNSFQGLLGRPPVHERDRVRPLGLRVPLPAGRDDGVVGVRVLHGRDQQGIPEHLRVSETKVFTVVHTACTNCYDL